MSDVMENKTFNFDFEDLRVESSTIETILGYKEGDDREIVSDLISEILTECHEISNVKAQYVIFKDFRLDAENKTIEINGQDFNVKSIVYGQLRKSEYAAVFLCTAGAEIGERSRLAMKEKDFLKGYVYDVTGSAIVEAAADLLQEDLEKVAGITADKITNRFSPGYCGWDVAEQHKLFSLIPDNYCDIHLTPSALMDPVKSISGIIGIGRNVRFNPYTCRMCNMKDCTYSKIKETLKH